MSCYNIINAIINIIDEQQRKNNFSSSCNYNQYKMGQPLEDYVKDAFSGAIKLEKNDKIKYREAAFSFCSSKNNPPAAILRKGNAIEIIKVASIGGIPLSSNYPKVKLSISDQRLSSFCRNVENGKWDNKDIIYTIGCVNGEVLKSLAFVYGTVYFADEDYYLKLFKTIKNSFNNSSFTLENTKELAHINGVDPLGITHFRARGVWSISHPFKAFNYLFSHNNNNHFELLAIIPLEKYNSFGNINKLEELSNHVRGLKIEDKKVINPNNKIELINTKIITYIQ